MRSDAHRTFELRGRGRPAGGVGGPEPVQREEPEATNHERGISSRAMAKVENGRLRVVRKEE